MKRIAIFTFTALACLGGHYALAEPPKAEPLHFSKLVPLLPDTIAGFAAEKAEGSTTNAMGFKLTQVSRVYRKGKDDAEQTVTLKIADGTGNEAFGAVHEAAVQFSNETTEGYEKGFTLDGNPAIERYTTESKDGTLTVFVDKRFLVEVQVNRLDGAAMQEWWKRLDIAKLKELKP